MSRIREVADALIDAPPVQPTPVDDLAARAAQLRRRRRREAFVVAAAVATLAVTSTAILTVGRGDDGGRRVTTAPVWSAASGPVVVASGGAGGGAWRVVVSGTPPAVRVRLSVGGDAVAEIESTETSWGTGSSWTLAPSNGRLHVFGDVPEAVSSVRVFFDDGSSATVEPSGRWSDRNIRYFGVQSPSGRRPVLVQAGGAIDSRPLVAQRIGAPPLGLPGEGVFTYSAIQRIPTGLVECPATRHPWDDPSADADALPGRGSATVADAARLLADPGSPVRDYATAPTWIEGRAGRVWFRDGSGAAVTEPATVYTLVIRVGADACPAAPTFVDGVPLTFMTGGLVPADAGEQISGACLDANDGDVVDVIRGRDGVPMPRCLHVRTHQHLRVTNNGPDPITSQLGVERVRIGPGQSHLFAAALGEVLEPGHHLVPISDEANVEIIVDG